MLAPDFDHDLRLFSWKKDLAVQRFLAQRSVEALPIAIPTTFWLDVGGLGSERRSVLEER